MTRLPVAFAGPAALLGGLTMSAVLVAGQAEISQLRADEGRRFPVVAHAESPFRVIGGIDVPETAPPRESVPSPSAAAAPLASPSLPGASDELLDPGALPEHVPAPGYVNRSGHATVDRVPEPARGLLHPAIDAATGTLRGITDALGVTDELRSSGQATAPVQREWHDRRDDAINTWREARRAD